MAGAKPGRRRKGERSYMPSRVPVEHKDRYKAEAERLGLDLGDYVAAVMAEHHGLPRPEYLDWDTGQQVLPLERPGRVREPAAERISA